MNTVDASPPAQQTKTPLSIKLGAEQRGMLAQIAQKQERSIHFLLCQAVTEFIDREQSKAAFYETAKTASDHYKTTGLHITHEELRAWADSLGSDNELTPPTCHA